jgi:hypothetical protein
VMYDIPSRKDVARCVITREVVLEHATRRWWAAAADRSASPRAAMASLLPAAMASQWQLPMITNDHQ